MVKSSSSIAPLPTTKGRSGQGKRQYKGVRMRSWGSWVSEIRAPNQKTRIWLGSYSTAEAAARAYDAALLCLRGNSSALNFPTSPPFSGGVPGVMSPKSIQRVAAAAAAQETVPATAPSPQTAPSPSEQAEAAANEGSTSLESLDLEAFFQSPRCMDYMLHPAISFFGAPRVEDCWNEEAGEISLWTFF
ncbi:ethylene-responsive transcription factor ERF014-like [Zingiber officinale]|uniref:ethylene-responsive transcription factor ERF014-like n=1 Tax=Zingiber officinale TaxID=94328 RepID=UPI001C4C5CCC|nr:ethylene-responsive transcription factor ERF014-like [Zingiber officinale]